MNASYSFSNDNEIHGGLMTLSLKSRVLRKLDKVMYGDDFPFTSNSNKKKFIFIHIPKSAGTSIRSALGELEEGRRHLPWWVYYNSSYRKYNEYFKFSFVRNPYERAESAYKYLFSGGNNREDLDVSKVIQNYSSFYDFVKFGLHEGEMKNHPFFWDQKDYLFDWRGRLKVDYLGRFESLQHDFDIICDCLGADRSKLEKINFGKPSVFGACQKSRKLLYEIYKNDFYALGYDERV